jgi:hypothetical protein
MATPSSMIIRSLQLLDEKAIGGTLSSAEQTAYLSALNAMLESWSLERLMVYQLLQESRALTASVGSFTIGIGGTWNTTRPNKICDPVFTRDANNVDYQMQIIDAQQYGNIKNKTIDGPYPQYLFYDAAYVAGLATIYLYPEPQSGLTLYINSWKQLQSFSTISDTLVLPPGYQRAIEFNFAIEVAGGLISVQPEVLKIARESKAAIKALNDVPTVLNMPLGVAPRRLWNINTGD